MNFAIVVNRSDCRVHRLLVINYGDAAAAQVFNHEDRHDFGCEWNMDEALRLSGGRNEYSEIFTALKPHHGCGNFHRKRRHVIKPACCRAWGCEVNPDFLGPVLKRNLVCLKNQSIREGWIYTVENQLIFR